MTQSSDIERLKRLERFSGLTDEEVHRIVEAGTAVHIPAHWGLIWEKTPADKAYLLLGGEVSIQHDGNEFARVGAGELIGETAIVTQHLRNATVVAFTDIEALHLTREAVVRLSESSPAFRKTLEESAAEHQGGAAE